MVLTTGNLCNGNILEGTDLCGFANVARTLALTQLTVIISTPSVHFMVSGESGRRLHTSSNGNDLLSLQTFDQLRLASTAVFTTDTTSLVITPGIHFTIFSESDGVNVTSANLDLYMTLTHHSLRSACLPSLQPSREYRVVGLYVLIAISQF